MNTKPKSESSKKPLKLNLAVERIRILRVETGIKAGWTDWQCRTTDTRGDTYTC